VFEGKRVALAGDSGSRLHPLTPWTTKATLAYL